MLRYAKIFWVCIHISFWFPISLGHTILIFDAQSQGFLFRIPGRNFCVQWNVEELREEETPPPLVVQIKVDWLYRLVDFCEHHHFFPFFSFNSFASQASIEDSKQEDLKQFPVVQQQNSLATGYWTLRTLFALSLYHIIINQIS